VGSEIAQKQTNMNRQTLDVLWHKQGHLQVSSCTQRAISLSAWAHGGDGTEEREGGTSGSWGCAAIRSTSRPGSEWGVFSETEGSGGVG
jgi:hypothetical protein